jgi:hypothetical protein
MVAEWKLGRRLQASEMVRHVNGDKLCSLPSNLMVESRKRKQEKTRPKFADPIFEAHRVLKEHSNHKVTAAGNGVSRELFSIKVMGSDNLAVNGIFVCNSPG